jgi:ribonuclease HIII
MFHLSLASVNPKAENRNPKEIRPKSEARFLQASLAVRRRILYDALTVVKPLTSYTCKLTGDQAAALRTWLETHGYQFRQVPYARFAAEKEKTNVVFYESGKLVVQGKGTQEFVEFVLEPEILQEVRLGYEAVLNPELLLPRLGVDESGKGDFFGPLCIAGVYVNEAVVKSWADVGIRDSKNISSDKRIRDLAELIRKTPGCVTSVVPIGNEAYNRLYAKMKSVNSMLAWGHARVIENLMGQRHRMTPPPVRAISDQFASNKDVVAKALMTLGREIELVQKHRAEEDMAVAAASILARHEFVTRLGGLEKKFGMQLPKGASTAVDTAAKAFIAQNGPEALPQVAKMHFRTALRAQGLPEPPNVQWRRRPTAPVPEAG